MRLLLTIPDSDNPKEVALLLQAALLGVVAVNRRILSKTQLPPLYQSGIKFRSEPTDGVDEIPDILTMFERGYGDCAPLVAARVAELQNSGEKAGVRIYWRPERSPLPFHAQVRRGNGQIEDPARYLGMVGRHYE